MEVDTCGEESRRYCVLASYGGGTPTLYFHGHYDVVPGAGNGQFGARLKSGKLFGRGSADMKGGLAAMLYAVRILKLCGVSLNGKVGITIVPDEETGGKYGSCYLLEKEVLGKDGVGMLSPEPTSGAIWNANRGALSLLVKVKGKSVHAILQHEGVNAFEQMVTVVNELMRLKSQVEARRTSFRIEPEGAQASILMLGGLCGGGVNFNIVPDECWFTVERRMNPEESLEMEKQVLVGLLEEVGKKGIELSYEILQEGESGGSPEETDLARALSSSVEELTGVAPEFEMCPGLLETRFYAQKGVPAYAYGPGLISVAHGPQEFVEVDAMCHCAAVYALTAMKMLNDG